MTANVRKRIHPNLLEFTSEYFRKKGIPEEFAFPCLANCIAAAIGRKFFLHTVKGPYFLNSFNFLVAGPGAGKSLAIRFMNDVTEATGLKTPIAPTSMTKASFVDTLGSVASRRVVGLDAADEVNQLMCNITEYGAFCGTHMTDEYLTSMTIFHDGEMYTEVRRHMDHPVIIPSPFVTLTAGTQPAFWAGQFPKKAWEQGFASRCEFYFADIKPVGIESFLPVEFARFKSGEAKVEEPIREIAHDIQCLVATVQGKIARQIGMHQDSIEWFSNWIKTTMPATAFTDPWLVLYEARRAPRLWRNAAVLCLTRADTEFEIRAVDFEKAWSLISPMEAKLQAEVGRINRAETADLMVQIYQWALTEYRTTGWVEHSRLVQFVSNKVDHMKIKAVIQSMVDSDAIELVDTIVKARDPKTGAPTVTQKTNVPGYKVNLKWEPVR